MKFKNNRAWVLAMDKLQGDIPDPTSFRPDECGNPDISSARVASSGNVSGVVMNATSDSPVKGMSAPGSARTGNGGGSMSC